MTRPTNAGRRLKRVPFMHGVPVKLTATDKTVILDIIHAAAEAMREYQRQAYPTMDGGGMSIGVTAHMLEYEAKVWASRVAASGYEDGDDHVTPTTAPAFRSRQIGRA